MGYTFRTSGPWGVGTGEDLTPDQIDHNFWQAIQDISAKAARGNSITNFVVDGTQVTVVWSDHTLLGPYQLPFVPFSFVGEWTPSTPYLTNDVFAHGDKAYIVLKSHTSAATFVALSANHTLLLSNPALNIPPGGEVGMMLFKSSRIDYEASWDWPTLVGMRDVMNPTTALPGDLLYWNGQKFGYIAATEVTVKSGRSLGDVQQAPPPNDGDLLYWNEGTGLFSFKSADTELSFMEMSDVRATPPPNDGDVVNFENYDWTYWIDSPNDEGVVHTEGPWFVFRPPELFFTGGVVMDEIINGEPNYRQAGQGGFRDVIAAEEISNGLHEGDWLSGYARWENDVHYRAPFVTPFQGIPPNGPFDNRRLFVYQNGGTIDLYCAPGPAQNGTYDWPYGYGFFLRLRGAAGLNVRPKTTTAGTPTIHLPPGRLPQVRSGSSEMILIHHGYATNHWNVDGDLAYSVVTLPTPTTGRASGFGSATGVSVAGSAGRAKGSGTALAVTSISMVINPAALDAETYKLTPTVDVTFNATSAPIGRRMTVVITTSGTVSRAIAFGTNFKTTGPLATGIVSSKVFSISFIGDGTNMNEVGRAAAM
jgi:hypothetical protein